MATITLEVPDRLAQRLEEVPRRQQWKTHFDLEGAVIVGRSSVGRASVRLLRMNEPEQVSERLRLQAIGRYPR